jgi:hypothetical protein
MLIANAEQSRFYPSQVCNFTPLSGSSLKRRPGVLPSITNASCRDRYSGWVCPIEFHMAIITDTSSINIPNFDDVRQSEGFKNVSLGNVMSAKAPDEKIPFISADDLAVYSKYRDRSFEIQVGNTSSVREGPVMSLK